MLGIHGIQKLQMNLKYLSFDPFNNQRDDSIIKGKVIPTYDVEFYLSRLDYEVN
jgi:hypothetical protein